MELMTVIVIIALFIEGEAFQYVFFKNRPFPMDLESRQIIFGNGTGSSNNGSISGNNTQNQCIQSTIGDSICDSINNRAECHFDGGDCCQGTCKANCIAKGVTDCKCGSNSYDCKTEYAPCVNCVHGLCETNMSKCYEDDELVKLGVMSCQLNSINQGNTNSSDYYCGKDPSKSIIHFLNSPSYHFPGCGIKLINCTENPCCEVVKLNKDTYETCTDEKKSRYVWDSAKKTYVLQFTSCLGYFRKCFKENAAGVSRGQCCQCREGWGGTNCDVPLCKKCVHGECVDENVCVCNGKYQGAGCNEAICDRCINGICIDPNVCECFYGFEGKTCEKKVTYPMCVHGVAIGQDQCQCDQGYRGRLCEIRICPPQCEYCDEELHCFDNLEKACDAISPKCIECSNRKCTKCKENSALINDNCCKHRFNALHLVSLDHQWPNCFKGNEIACTECKAPYHLDAISGLCIHNGMIEIGSRYQTSLETEGSISINFNRYYGTDGQCRVFYELLPIFNVNQVDYINNPLNKMPLSTGMLTFLPGEETKELLLPLSADSFTLPTSMNVFRLSIFNPIGGCLIGDVHQSQIEIFDNKVIDLSSLSFAVTSSSIPIVNGQYQIFSTVASFDIEAHLTNSPIEITLIATLASTKSNVAYSSMMTFNGSGKYSLSLPYLILKSGPSFIGTKSLSVLFCETGSFYKMRFFDYAGIEREDVPYFIRNSKSISIDDYYKSRSYFSIEWSFYMLNPGKKMYIDVFIPSNDIFILLINSKVVQGEKKLNASDPSLATFSFAFEVIDADVKYFEVSFGYVHLKDKSSIEISYSFDQVSHQSFDGMRRFACYSQGEYTLKVY